MSNQNLSDDPLVSFDQEEPQTSPIKTKSSESYEDRSLADIDPFGNHNGQETHHDGINGNKNNNANEFSLTDELFPVDPSEHEKDVLHQFSTRENEESEDSVFNSQSKLNGSVADKNTLLLDLDPEAPSPSKPTNMETPSPNDPFKQFENLSSHQETKSDMLLDFESSPHSPNQQASNTSAFDAKSPDTNENVPVVSQSNENENELLHQAYDDVDHAAQDLASKLDLVTSPSADRHSPPSFNTEQQPVGENQPATSPKLDSPSSTASPGKKPTASATKPTSATKTKQSIPTATTTKSTESKSTTGAASKSTEQKSAVTTTKSTEAKPATTTRKTLHSAPTATAAASNKSKVTTTSPSQEPSTAAKSTRDVPAKTATAAAKPKPAPSTTTTTTTATTASSRSSVKPVTKPTRPSTVPKASDSTSTSDQQTTILSTAPEGSSSSSTVPTPSRASAKPPQLSTRAPSKTASGGASHATTVSRAAASTSKTTVPKERPTSQSRATTTRPSTGTSASTTVAPKRATSANRPSTADATSRTARSGATEGAAGATATAAKPQWNSASSKVGSLQNTTHKPGGGAVKIPNQKLQWNVKSKVGSLDNASHKPGGGAVKIESKKLDFKEKAKPRTDTGKNETVTSGGEEADEASATGHDDHPKEGEPSDETFESEKN